VTKRIRTECIRWQYKAAVNGQSNQLYSRPTV